MGAFGAALVARDQADGAAADAPTESTLLGREELDDLQVTTVMERCAGCANNCLLTITRFSDHRQFVSGNRCERGARAGRGG